MKDTIAARLAALDARLKEIDHRLADPDVVNDLDNYRRLSQERAEIHQGGVIFADVFSRQELGCGQPEMRATSRGIDWNV